MQIKRDYSQPLFGRRKERRGWVTPRVVFVFGTMIGVLLVYVYINFGMLQHQALELIGLGPTPTPLPSDLATVATNLVIQGDMQGAADLFIRALEQRPDDVNYMHEYGQLLIEMGDTTQAIELADRMIELSSGDPRGYALKARALVWAGNPTSAISAALAGIAINGSYSPLYSALARAYSDSGQYADGVDTGLRAVELDPGDVEARRAYAYTLSWVSAYEEAIDQLETAIALNPNNVSTYFELALQYLAQNRDQEAIDLYDRVLALQPRNARANLRQCEAYRKVGQFERAMGFCQDAVNYDPTYTQAYYQLGILRYNRFNFLGALESFDKCLQNDPESLECLYRLGLSYYYVAANSLCVLDVETPECAYRRQSTYFEDDDCTTAWNLLQDALLIAQNRAGTEAVVENIRLGLVAIGQQCIQFRGIAPTPPPEATEESTPEAGV